MLSNRWYHPPRLHSPNPGEERRVGWIELFYDLVYVATIIQLGDALSSHATAGGFLLFTLLFTGIWYAWSSFTFYSNRFVVDDAIHRILVFMQMFGIAAMAISASNVFTGDTTRFAAAYALVRLVLVAFYIRSWRTAGRGQALSAGYALRFGASAVFWFASVFVAPPWTWPLWLGGLAVELSAPLGRKMRELTLQYPPDAAHLAERYGLLTIIVLGESFVKVLGDLAGHKHTGWETVGMGGLALLVTCSVWWIYFDDVVHSRIRPVSGARFLWHYSHLPLAIGITSMGVGIKKIVGADPGAAMTSARWMFAGSLGLVFLSVAALDWATERDESQLDDTVRVWIRLASAAAVLSLAAVGHLIDSWISLGLIALVCIAQVVADLIIVPYSEGEMDRASMQTSFEVETPEAAEEIRATAEAREVR